MDSIYSIVEQNRATGRHLFVVLSILSIDIISLLLLHYNCVMDHLLAWGIVMWIIYIWIFGIYQDVYHESKLFDYLHKNLNDYASAFCSWQLSAGRGAPLQHNDFIKVARKQDDKIIDVEYYQVVLNVGKANYMDIDTMRVPKKYQFRIPELNITCQSEYYDSVLSDIDQAIRNKGKEIIATYNRYGTCRWTLSDKYKTYPWRLRFRKLVQIVWTLLCILAVIFPLIAFIGSTLEK